MWHWVQLAQSLTVVCTEMHIQSFSAVVNYAYSKVSAFLAFVKTKFIDCKL